MLLFICVYRRTQFWPWPGFSSKSSRKGQKSAMLRLWGCRGHSAAALPLWSSRLHAHHLLTSSETRRWNSPWSNSLYLLFSPISSEPEMNTSHKTDRSPSIWRHLGIESLKPDAVWLPDKTHHVCKAKHNLFFPPSLRLIWKRKILCVFVNSGAGTYWMAS